MIHLTDFAFAPSLSSLLGNQGILATSSLVEISCPGIGPQYFFIALVMKKPLMQVLIKGSETTLVDEQRNIVLLPTGGVGKVPAICTGHQAFQELCAGIVGSGHALPEKLHFFVHKYTLNPFTPLLAARVVPGGDCHAFLVKHTRQNTGPTKTPFGIKRKKRKRASVASSKKGGARAKAKASGTVPTPDWKPEDVNRELKNLFPQFVPGKDVASSDDSDDNAKTATSISEDASHSSSDENLETENLDKPGPDFDTPGISENANRAAERECQPKEAEERVLPQSIKEEVRRTNQLANDRGKRLECEQSKQKPKTRCNSKLGLVLIDTQVAARLAACRHCLGKIPKGSPRFGFAWNLAKFHSYLHPDCAFEHLLQEETDLEEALAFITDKLQLQSSMTLQERQASLSLQSKLEAHLEAVPCQASSSSSRLNES